VEEFWTGSVLDNNELQRHVVREEKLDVIGAWMFTSCRNCMLLTPEWKQAPEL
jgi:hypothetical protein